MPTNSCSRFIIGLSSKRTSVRTALIVPFILQVGVAVGFVGYLIFRNKANPQQTILLCLVTLGLAILVGLIASYWITQPLLQIPRPSIPPSENDSNQYVRFWTEYAHALEQELSDRTAELVQIKQQLQQETQKREQAEADVHHSQEQLRLITDSVPAGIAYVDAERRYRFINKAYEQRFKRPREEMLGKYVWEVIGQDTYHQVKATIDQVLQGERKSIEFDITYDNGKTSYINSILSPAFDESQRVIGYYLVFFDITERRQLENSLKAANDQLERLVTCDGLTQIANRRKFDDYLNHEWKRLARTKERLSLILFDVDYFKRYNDYYGHQAGDNCLLQVAQAVQAAVNRPADLVARYGGEEFAVILPDTDREGAIAIARNVQQAIRAQAIHHERSEVSEIITVSLGIASLIPSLDRSPDDLVGLADQALYAAKQQGRDRWAVSSI